MPCSSLRQGMMTVIDCPLYMTVERASGRQSLLSSRLFLLVTRHYFRHPATN
jgi:hypothetical protein